MSDESLGYSSGCSSALGRTTPTPDYSNYIEVTLNHPRTPTFVKKLSHQQKRVYEKFYMLIKTYYISIIEESDYVYEVCKSGIIHMHCWFKFKLDPFIPSIILNDIVKLWFNHMPKKYQVYNEKNYYYKIDRYYSPSIVAQYRTNIDKFKEYMKKSPV